MEDFGLKEEQVSKGVSALFEYIKKKGDTQSELLNTPQSILVQFGVKRIIGNKGNLNKIVKVILPHSLLQETSEVCLFVKDQNLLIRDYSETLKYYKSLLKKKGITQNIEVIPLKALKLEHREFEAKRNLANRYDVYLADERVGKFLPRLLGKSFIRKNRFPIQLKLTAQDLQNEFDKALHTSLCVIGGKGSTFIVRSAHSGLDPSHAVENVMAVIKKVAETVPGGAVNIKSMHVKTELSPSLPIFISEGSADEVAKPKRKRKLVLDEFEEISTQENVKARVTPWGAVEVINADDCDLKVEIKKKKVQKGEDIRQKTQTKIKKHVVKMPKKTSVKTSDKNSQQRTVKKTKTIQKSSGLKKSKLKKAKASK